MTTDGRGLYVHIPFCLKKCNYCDFASFSDIDSALRKEYIRAVVAEIFTYRTTPKIKIDTIFFGGGTPSLLTPCEFSDIVDAIFSAFEVSKNVEFTIEANPKTLDEQKLLTFVKRGVNRLSIGVQSAHENELRYLGRIHTFSDAAESVALAKACGINNINVDVMYSIPEQTVDSFEKTLDAVIALGVTHLSAYGLILEENTDFWSRRDILPLPTEDEECEMYRLVNDKLKENGFVHYEISNYARASYECKHNLKYWHDREYIGVGLSAHSYFENKRYENQNSLKEYIYFDFADRKKEEIDSDAAMYEYAMMNLRLSDGVDLYEYEQLFGKSFLDGRREVLDRFVSLGLLCLTKDRIFLTEEGFYLSNTVLSEIL